MPKAIRGELGIHLGSALGEAEEVIDPIVGDLKCGERKEQLGPSADARP